MPPTSPEHAGSPSPRKGPQGGRGGEELLALILDTVDVGICVTDAQGRYVRVNPAYCRIFGYTAEEMLGRSLLLLIVPPERRDAAPASYRATFAAPAPRERVYVRKDGTRRLVSITSAPLVTAQGERVLVSAVTDITERRRAEEELRERERFIDGVMRAVPDNVYVYDLAERRVVFTNRRVYDALGFTPEQIEAMGGDLLPRLLHPDDQVREAERVRQWEKARDGELLEFEYRLRDVRGDWHWLRFRETVFRRDEAGRVRQVIGSGRDITQRKRAEEELREREHFIQGIVGAVPDTLFVFDLAQRRVVYSNRGDIARLGYPPEEVVGMGGDVLPRLVHPEDLPGCLRSLEDWAGAADGEVREVEYRLRDAGGAWHWFHNYMTVFRRDEAGRPRQVIGSARDVTERKRAEEELREREHFIQGVLRALPDSLFVYDLARRRIVFSNRARLDMLGFGEQPIEGLDLDALARLIHPDDLAQMERALEGAAGDSEGDVREAEYRLRHADGSWRWMHVYSTVFRRDADSRVRQIMGSARDVTERRRAEEALRVSDEMLRKAFENAPLGIATAYADGHLGRVNAAFCRMLGYTEEELLRRTVADITHPDDREPENEYIRGAVEGTKHFWQIEKRFLHKSGAVVHARLTNSVIRDEKGLAFGVSLIEDITERKKAEEERRRLEEQYREAQKLESLGVLAGGVAHDFNNLLTAILGYGSLAQQEAPAGSPAYDYLDQVLQAGRRAAEICQQMLAYAGRGQYVVGPVDLSRLAREIAVLLGASIPKPVSLSFRLTPDLPPVQGDAEQLRQVVLNLLLNAAEAVGAGPREITLHTSRARYDPAQPGAAYVGAELREGDYVALEVTDTGVGMDEATRQRIFEPFFTTKFTGRGLGMAAVLGIVRGHHGGIRVVSEPGRGTTVRVLLPPATEGSGDARRQGPQQ